MPRQQPYGNADLSGKPSCIPKNGKCAKTMKSGYVFVQMRLIFTVKMCILVLYGKDKGRYTVYLKRKVDAFLREWKADPARKPLIIKGSRQVGKTESIRKFSAETYENVVEINFVRDEKYKGILADGYEAAAVIKNISLIDPSKRFVPHKTLLFFDEITEFPEIATSIKFFMRMAVSM